MSTGMSTGVSLRFFAVKSGHDVVRQRIVKIITNSNLAGERSEFPRLAKPHKASNRLAGPQDDDFLARRRQIDKLLECGRSVINVYRAHTGIWAL